MCLFILSATLDICPTLPTLAPIFVTKVPGTPNVVSISTKPPLHVSGSSGLVLSIRLSNLSKNSVLATRSVPANKSLPTLVPILCEPLSRPVLISSNPDI